MKEVEKMIIDSCYGEEQYKKVSFLEPNDFADRNYRKYFHLMKESKGDIVKLMASIHNQKQILSIVFQLCSVSGVNNVQKFALLLLEIRFKYLLAILLTELSVKTQNHLEASLLNNLTLSISSVDIFDLSDSLLEYLGHQASNYTKSRINSFLQYRDERIRKAKEVING